MLEVEKHLPLRDYPLFPKYVGHFMQIFVFYSSEALLLNLFPLLNYLLSHTVKEQGNEMQTQLSEY